MWLLLGSQLSEVWNSPQYHHTAWYILWRSLLESHAIAHVLCGTLVICVCKFYVCMWSVTSHCDLCMLFCMLPTSKFGTHICFRFFEWRSCHCFEMFVNRARAQVVSFRSDSLPSLNWWVAYAIFICISTTLSFSVLTSSQDSDTLLNSRTLLEWIGITGLSWKWARRASQLRHSARWGRFAQLVRIAIAATIPAIFILDMECH